MMRAGHEVTHGDDLENTGFAMIPDVFEQLQIDTLIDTVSNINDPRANRSRNGVFAIRNLLNISPEIKKLAVSDPIQSIMEEHFKDTPFPVRAALFDKIVGANWLVPWHQDLTICVADRLNVEGYGPWTLKAGVWNVQPPVRLLENMLSIRIHLDDCNQLNGALRVLPGTHMMGRLTPEQMQEEQRLNSAVSCEVRAGGAVLMRPLLMHASSAASTALHRRVIHIDYATGELDGGLQWLGSRLAALPDVSGGHRSLLRRG